MNKTSLESFDRQLFDYTPVVCENPKYKDLGPKMQKHETLVRIAMVVTAALLLIVAIGLPIGIGVSSSVVAQPAAILGCILGGVLPALPLSILGILGAGFLGSIAFTVDFESLKNDYELSEDKDYSRDGIAQRLRNESFEDLRHIHLGKLYRKGMLTETEREQIKEMQQAYNAAKGRPASQIKGEIKKKWEKNYGKQLTIFTKNSDKTK